MSIMNAAANQVAHTATSEMTTDKECSLQLITD